MRSFDRFRAHTLYRVDKLCKPVSLWHRNVNCTMVNWHHVWTFLPDSCTWFFIPLTLLWFFLFASVIRILVLNERNIPRKSSERSFLSNRIHPVVPSLCIWGLALGHSGSRYANEFIHKIERLRMSHSVNAVRWLPCSQCARLTRIKYSVFYSELCYFFSVVVVLSHFRATCSCTMPMVRSVSHSLLCSARDTRNACIQLELQQMHANRNNNENI